ncbi:MAG TPA: amino acid ABC transporter substrate-binding protein [Magnetospirillaceae bacterium]
MNHTHQGTSVFARSAALASSIFGILAVAGAALTAPATAASAADEVVIGAPLPLNGPLAGFGSFDQWGYQHAVDEVNKAGGVTIDGKKRMVKLIIRDDKTDPNVSASNVETLISRDHVTALLGSCTPMLVNAGALVAERHKVPMVTGCDPLGAFTSVRKWNWVWDIFFDERELASLAFKTMKDLGIKTDNKMAIMADNGPDGLIVGGKVWPMLAKENGYEVVANGSFPVDNTQFTSIVAQAKNAGADVVMSDFVTPPAVALRKQMKEGGYSPKLMVIEKGAEPVQFAEALGPLAEGILVGGYWDPSFPYPGAADLEKQFEKDTGKSGSQHIADSYAAAKVLLDAIEAAGSTDPAKINAAIAKTDKTYVVGPVKFSPEHTSKLELVEDQWQNGKSVVVWPANRATGKFEFPIPN